MQLVLPGFESFLTGKKRGRRKQGRCQVRGAGKQLNLFEWAERKTKEQLETLYWQAAWELKHLWHNAAHLFCSRTGVGLEHADEIAEELPLLVIERLLRKRLQVVKTIEQAKNVIFKFARRFLFALALTAAERLGIAKRCQVKGRKFLVSPCTTLDAPLGDSAATAKDLLVA